jgi:hypothetical protein
MCIKIWKQDSSNKMDLQIKFVLDFWQFEFLVHLHIQIQLNQVLIQSLLLEYLDDIFNDSYCNKALYISSFSSIATMWDLPFGKHERKPWQNQNNMTIRPKELHNEKSRLKNQEIEW